MQGKISELQVGIITIFALVVLVVGILWLKNIDLSRGEVNYFVDFAKVEGMKGGDRVQVRGIRMGKVVGMQIGQGSVRVEIAVEEAADLREDAEVVLGEKGIVGEIVLEIDPGRGAPATAGHVFVGKTSGTIADMTDAAGSALIEMRQLTQKVTDLIEEIKDTGMVVETLTQANNTLTKVDTMVEQNHSKVKVILDDLAITSESLRVLMESGQVDAALSGTTAAMTRADTLLANLEGSATRLESILIKLDEGEGTAATLLNEPGFYTRVDSTLTSVQRLMDAMRRNPKHFFKMSVVDF